MVVCGPPPILPLFPMLFVELGTILSDLFFFSKIALLYTSQLFFLGGVAKLFSHSGRVEGACQSLKSFK